VGRGSPGADAKSKTKKTQDRVRPVKAISSRSKTGRNNTGVADVFLVDKRPNGWPYGIHGVIILSSGPDHEHFVGNRPVR
jgi:hypothetical protein